MNRAFDVIIIGGGASGCSTAMQLSLQGRSVLVLDKAQFGSGSTGQAAGLGAQLRSNPSETRLLMEGIEVVGEMERKLNEKIFTRTGSLHVAATEDRAGELRDFVESGKTIGFDIDLVDREFAKSRLPCMRTDDLIEFCYCPTDGHFAPSELLNGYIRIARDAGATFLSQTRVEDIMMSGGRVKGVQTAGASFFAPVVVNAAGPWSYLVAELTQTPMATATLGHYYLVTEPVSGVQISPTDAAIRDRANRIYSRPEMGGLLVGSYEQEPVEYSMEALPEDFQMSEIRIKRDNLNVALLIEAASQRFPFINERTPMSITTGIMTFTPDGHALCGPVHDVEGLYYCTGFNGRGVFQSTSVGFLLADIICKGRSRYQMGHLDADRFSGEPWLGDRESIRTRCCDRYANHYLIAPKS
ncbi:MAG: FAD-dependent oxidoreductase [Verrucomicrobiota bacterium]|jgi:4-methylaminobutanoate oxidase (formaldehyde-forming)|nr:FAD-dependent oxidoreductase [Verrucomicrobiota bacterium]MDP7178380.1 FAD-dependent oxidoreductase [Verrucomicrobiota bacterium]